ncbi:hypothetical protein CKQ90_27485, partial [Klebsiella pneumoniae]
RIVQRLIRYAPGLQRSKKRFIPLRGHFPLNILSDLPSYPVYSCKNLPHVNLEIHRVFQKLSAYELITRLTSRVAMKYLD